MRASPPGKADEAEGVCSDLSEGDPPVPMPTTVVKPLCADGTAPGTGWESKTSLHHLVNGVETNEWFRRRFLLLP